MKDKVKVFIGVAIIALLLGGLGYDYFQQREKINQYEKNERAIQAAFHKRELAYDSILRENINKRKTLEYLLDSALVVAADLNRRDSLNQHELLQIKGKYNKLSSSQLSQEMLKQYHEQ